jgi:hypothetical protein
VISGDHGAVPLPEVRKRIMTKPLIIIAAWLLIFFSVNSSSAAEPKIMTANRMVDFCTSPPDSTNGIFCGAYMAGFVDAISLAQATATTTHTCIPDYFSGAEARAIFVRFMKDKAELGELSFSEVVWFAITEQFPCRK